MKRTNWIVGEYGVRPAGKPNECFYCHAKVGEEHKEDCVIRCRTVNVDFTIHTVMCVPECWDENDINFKFNESSWCVSNLIKDIVRREEDFDKCPCFITEAKYIGEATEEDEDIYALYKVKEFES